MLARLPFSSEVFMRALSAGWSSLVAGLPLAAALLAACPSDKPAEPTAPPAVPPTVAAATTTAAAAPAAAPSLDLAEPAGIAAGAHKIPGAQGDWSVDAAATNIAFTIVSNSAGPITGRFPGAAAGSYDDEAGRGVFTVDLTKLVTTNKEGTGNPVRDTNVIEAFFGARPFANASLRQAVDTAWQALVGKIASGVSRAALVVDAVEGDAKSVADGASATGTVKGRLLLWESLEVPLSMPVSASRKGDVVEIRGTETFTFHIEKATGSALRKKLFDTMLAAGCAHQPGIQNEVTLALEQVTLRRGAPNK